MRKCFYIILILIAMVGSYHIIQELRDEFSLDNISFVLPERPEWHIPAPNPEELTTVKQILSQPFAYLGKGHQVYAFESADGLYVLKLVKFTYLKPATLLNAMPDWKFIQNYKDHVARGKRMRIDRVCNGYRLAYEIDKEGCGLVFLHLMPSTAISKSITLKNRWGRSYSVDLDRHAFILQKKAVASRDEIRDLLNSKNIALAKERFRNILALYLNDYQKGVYDNDHNVMYNTGFAGSQAMRLDVGRLKFDPRAKDPAFIQADLNKIVYKRIGRWLKKYYPNYADELMRDMELHLSHHG